MTDVGCYVTRHFCNADGSGLAHRSGLSSSPGRSGRGYSQQDHASRKQELSSFKRGTHPVKQRNFVVKVIGMGNGDGESITRHEKGILDCHRHHLGCWAGHG